MGGKLAVSVVAVDALEYVEEKAGELCCRCVRPGLAIDTDGVSEFSGNTEAEAGVATSPAGRAVAASFTSWLLLILFDDHLL